jgi:peptidyl-prolyl cis-trans isomerase D
VDGLTRRGLPPFISARVVDALFSDDSIKSKRNTQAMEVSTNALVSARIVEYRPAATRPLEQVKAQVKQLVEQREALRLARAAGEARLAELRKQPSDAGFSAAKTVSRSAPQDIPPAALNAIMRAPSDKLPAYAGAEIDGGYLIAQIVSSKVGATASSEQREAQDRVLQQQAAAADQLVYAEGLKARHDVRVLKPDYQRPAVKSEAVKSDAVKSDAPKADAK